MRVVYIGLKDLKADNVAATGLVWKRGEVLEVTDEKKAAKLMDHPLIWRDADKPYEMLAELKVVTAPEPRVNLIAEGKDASPFWEPVIIPVPTEVFKRLQDKSLIAVFMTASDADAFAEWKATNAITAGITPPEASAPKAQKAEELPAKNKGGRPRKAA